MNIFKKTLPVLLALLVFSPISVFAQEDTTPGPQSSSVSRPNVIVYDVDINDSDKILSSDQSVEISFTIANQSTTDAKNFQYYIELVGRTGQLFDSEFVQKDIDLKSFATISQASLYKVSQGIPNGEYSLRISAVDENGVPHGSDKVDVSIQNENNNYLVINSSYINYNEEVFDLQYGLSLESSSEIAVLNLNFDSSSARILNLSLDIYQRSQFSGQLLETRSLGSVDLSAGENLYEEKIPTDLKPGVYEAVLKLSDSNSENISQKVPFRFIIQGKYANIAQIEINENRAIDDGILEGYVSVTGTSYVNNPDTPEVASEPEFSASLKIDVVDSVGNIINSFNKQVQLNSSEVKVDLNEILSQKISNFQIRVSVSDSETGEEFDTASYDFGSGNFQSPVVENFGFQFWISILIAAVILLILLIILALNKKHNKTIDTLIIVLFAGIAFALMQGGGVSATSPGDAPYVDDSTRVYDDVEFGNGLYNQLLDNNIDNFDYPQKPSWSDITFNSAAEKTNYVYESITGVDTYNGVQFNPSYRPNLTGVSVLVSGSVINRALTPGEQFSVQFSGSIYMCSNLPGSVFASATHQGSVFQDSKSIAATGGHDAYTSNYQFELGTFTAESTPGTYTITLVVYNYSRTADWPWNLGPSSYVNGNPYLRGYETVDLVYTVVDSSDPISVSCSASPNPADVDETVTWTASASGGSESGYTYSWSGAVSGSGSTQTSSHSTETSYSATVSVTDDENNTTTDTCFVSVCKNNNCGGGGNNGGGNNGGGGNPSDIITEFNFTATSTPISDETTNQCIVLWTTSGAVSCLLNGDSVPVSADSYGIDPGDYNLICQSADSSETENLRCIRNPNIIEF